jgi:hypothetical protein
MMDKAQREVLMMRIGALKRAAYDVANPTGRPNASKRAAAQERLETAERLLVTYVDCITVTVPTLSPIRIPAAVDLAAALNRVADHLLREGAVPEAEAKPARRRGKARA